MLELNATSIAVILNFIILVWILNHFLYKPILKMLQDRKQYVENTLAEAEKSKIEGEKLKYQYEEKIQKAEEEGRSIVEKARVFSGNIKRDAFDAAKFDSNLVRERALKDAERTKTEMLVKLKTEIGGMATSIAAKILKRTIDEKDHAALIDEFTGKLGDSELN